MADGDSGGRRIGSARIDSNHRLAFRTSRDRADDGWVGHAQRTAAGLTVHNEWLKSQSTVPGSVDKPTDLTDSSDPTDSSGLGITD